jgi:group I intron endonuclease
MNKISGIYIIRSKINPNRYYIGSSIDIYNRWKLHLRALKNNRHHSQKLQRHYNKYSGEDLAFDILLTCTEEELIEKEQLFINAMKPWFNSCPIAGSRLHSSVSKETRNKIRESLRGRIISPEVRAKMGGGNRGKHLSAEHKRKIGIANRGRRMSEEQKRALSEKVKGEKSPRWGTKLSKEYCDKMSIGMKRVWREGKERGDKMSMTGRRHTEESRRKMGDHQRSNKKVIDVETNKIYVSIAAAAVDLAINYSTLYAYLYGVIKNKTTLRLME